MNKCSAVALALGAAGIAAIFLGRRRQPEPVSDADLKKQLRQIHDDLFFQRRLSVGSRRVLNDTHKHILAVTKTLEKQPS